MDVLKKAYHGVFSLQEYLHSTLPEAVNQELLVNHRKGFQVFLSKTLVGVSENSSAERRIIPYLRTETETDEQTQVVEEVVHELVRSGRRNNVLTLGLSRSGPCDAGLSFHPDHNYPQLITPHWSKLLQIIGKSFMKDLLQNTSIFTEVASCYIQLSGVPVHIILSEKTHSHSKSSADSKKNVPTRPTHHHNSSTNLDQAISAVTLCYDKGFQRKLHKSHPLNSLAASNVGANYLTYQIFQREKLDKGKISKKKMKRIPQRLRRSKDLLKQLLINFKKTRLQVFHRMPVTEVDVIQQERASPADSNLQLPIPSEHYAGPSTDITMETALTMTTKEDILPCEKDALNSAAGSEEVVLGKLENDSRTDERDEACGITSSEKRAKDHGKSGANHMSGCEILTEIDCEKGMEATKVDMMEGHTVSLSQLPPKRRDTSSAFKDNMIPDFPERNSRTGDQNCFGSETDSVNASKAVRENSLENLVTDDCTGSSSSVLDGSIELFSSPEGVGRVREVLAQNEMGAVLTSSTNSSSESEKKLDAHEECEFVRKHVALATVHENRQLQHFQKYFDKVRNSLPSSNTTKQREKESNFNPLEVTDHEMAKLSNGQNEEVSGKETSLQQGSENSGEDASLPSESVCQSLTSQATADENMQLQHFQKCFDKVRNSVLSSYTTRERERESNVNPLEVTDRGMTKLSNGQNEEVCGRDTSLQQGFENCGEDALSSSQSVCQSLNLKRDVTHIDEDPTEQKTYKKIKRNTVGEENRSFFDGQENTGNVVYLEKAGVDSISKAVEFDKLLEQNKLSTSNRNSNTMVTAVVADILDSCDDVIMNEDEFVNEESQKMSGSHLHKAGGVDVKRTVVLQGSLLESCDDEHMGEESFICERGRVDKGGEVKISSNEETDSEKFIEKDALPHLSGGSFSKENLRRTNIDILRKQLQQKLKQKKARRNSFFSKCFHSCKNRKKVQTKPHQCCHRNKRDFKSSRRKNRTVLRGDDRCMQSRLCVSRQEDRYNVESQEKSEKISTLSSDHSCHAENRTFRSLSHEELKSINSTDLNISVTEGEVESFASNTHIREHSGESSTASHNRNCLPQKTYSGKNTIKWTVSKSKERNRKTGFHGNSNLKPIRRKTQILMNKSRKDRNILNMQFGQDSPLAKGLSGGEVYISLRGLLKKIIPEHLWGSTANQNSFFKFLKLFLKLGRFESLPLSLMTKSLQFSDCDWTRGTEKDWKRRPRTDRIKRRELMEELFSWLVTDLTIPLIRMLYYVTETSVSKNELVYYPKEVWKKMQEKAINDYKKSGVVTPVDEESVKLMIMSQKTLGRSKLRFIPKETGFRPIVKMGKSTLPDKQKFGINLLLRDLLDVLSHLRRVHPQLFASSLLGITSIYPKWKEFAEKRHQEGKSRPLYFVKVDISKCYDSIPHDKLPEVVAAHLKQHNLAQKYLIRRYTVTSVSGLGDIRKKAMRHVTPVEGEHNFGHSFHQLLRDLIKDGSHHKSVITNQASFHLETVDSLLSRLRQLINYDIVSIGNLDFLRTKGISQGSVLSSLLCSIFYGNMENRYLTGVDKDGLLMRLIDDFLLVTPHLHCATKFLEVLLSGECAEMFGCRVNPQKTLTNFEFIYEGEAVQQLQGDWFPWCGFLFNVKTLEVKNDYQRYAATSFRYSMTLSFSSEDTLKMMKLKLIQALHRSKGLVIFIDPSINSQRVITENIYHLFLLTAFRFHSYHQALPQSLKRRNTTQDLLGIILDIGPSFYFKAKNTLQRLPAEEEFPLSLIAVKWLCIKAFDVKLSRHFGVYGKLLLPLKQQRRKLSRKMDSSTRHSLSQGSIPDIPADFKKTRL